MLVSGPTFASTALVKIIFLVTVLVSCVRSLHLIYQIFTYRFVTEETRIRWIQSQNSAEALLSKIKGVVNSGVYKAEEALHRLYSLLVGGWEDGKSKTAACGDAAKTEWEEAKDAFETSTESAEDLVNKAKEKLDEKVKVGERKVKTEL